MNESLILHFVQLCGLATPSAMDALPDAAAADPPSNPSSHNAIDFAHPTSDQVKLVSGAAAKHKGSQAK